MPPTRDEYAGHIKQYRLFHDVVRFMCDDLRISFKAENIDKTESDKGSTYRAHMEGKHTLNFLLDTIVKTNKIQEVRAAIDIEYDKGSASFCTSEDVAKYINEDGYLTRWATRAIHNFNLKHHPVNLNTLFATTEIRVYGAYSDHTLALKEMKFLLYGMQFIKMDNPIVYKFRHVNDLTRTFSYCIFVKDDYYPNFWAFFHNMGGLDSGGYRTALKSIEDMISTNTTVDFRRVDIKYAILRKFLSEHVTTFNRVEQDTISFDLYHVWGNFGLGFAESYSKFLESYDNSEYHRALRDLRTLLQTAMEIVCEKHKIAIPRQSTIAKLCSLLIKNKVLDGKTRTWYCAFLSIANLPAHREAPIDNDLSYQNEDRIRITILLGTQLINELGGIIDWLDDSENDA